MDAVWCAFDRDCDGLSSILIGRKAQPSISQVQFKPLSSIAEPEVKISHACGEGRVKGNCFTPGVDTGVSALNEIVNARHGSQVDSFFGRAALDVGDVAF